MSSDVKSFKVGSRRLVPVRELEKFVARRMSEEWEKLYLGISDVVDFERDSITKSARIGSEFLLNSALFVSNLCYAMPIASRHFSRHEGSGAGDGIRTRDPLLGKQLRYHCATPAEHLHPTPKPAAGQGVSRSLRPCRHPQGGFRVASFVRRQ